MKITTIARNPKDSPNMAANDTAILERITELLAAMGTEVISINENDSVDNGTDVVCHMTRTAGTLEMLKNCEKRGIKVINPPRAVEACSRKEFMARLEHAAVPQPAFCVVESDEQLDKLSYPAWIKNAEGWSRSKDDVSYARNAMEAKEHFALLRKRGKACCIHSRHITGDLVKFYGIGNRFLYYCYPDTENGKFGLERINGVQKHYRFCEKILKEVVACAAKAIGTEIYGGDCIVDANGRIYIIDFNDFPSFSAIRDVAAKEIAELIMNCKNK